MCSPQCCDSIGSNLAIQVSYILACAWFALYFLVWFSIELTFRLDDEWSPQGSGDSTFEVLRIGAGITSLCTFAVWVLAIASRCCAPCCCGLYMEKVPEPCPCGECSLQNPRLLDYPLFIGFGGHVVCNLLLDGPVLRFFPWKPLEEQRRLPWLRLVRLLNVIWILFALVGICLGIRKLQLMRRGVVQRSLPPAMVVGQPISAPVPNPHSGGEHVAEHPKTVAAL